MILAYDAKRAFFNQSGLGNYSRNLLNALFHHFPENKYLLYTPCKADRLFDPPRDLTEIKLPERFFDRAFSSLWRSFRQINDLERDRPDIYHGLSHEIPYRIERSGIKSVVTIHDLIFFRYPHLYKPADRFIYRKKFGYACRHADRIVAVSRQTATDIQEYFHISHDKIDVVYQGYNPVFDIIKSDEEKSVIRQKYRLPEKFILYVGTIEERKNLLGLIQAVHRGKLNMPVVAVGRKTGYFKSVHDYLEKHNLHNICFIDTVNNEELPAFYQMAEVFVYPSVFEGFGIPVLESVVSGTPVITSKGGCFAEAGGPASVYINPTDDEELAEALMNVLNNPAERENMIREGKKYAENFTQKNIAVNMMNVYRKILQ